MLEINETFASGLFHRATIIISPPAFVFFIIIGIIRHCPRSDNILPHELLLEPLGERKVESPCICCWGDSQLFSHCVSSTIDGKIQKQISIP